MHTTVDAKIDQWFEDRGIVANGKTMSQAIKTLEETTELIDAINTNNLLEIVDAVGDIYVTLRGVCVVQGIDLTECAELAYNEIKDRKGQLRADGTFVKEHDRLPEKLMSDDFYTPHPGPLDGKKFTQQQFDEVAEGVDTYKHDASYYDTERNKPITDGLYERSIKEKYGQAVQTVSELMQEELEPLPDLMYARDEETGRNKQVSRKEYFDSLPDVVHSTEAKETAVWRDDPNDPKIIPFKEGSKDVD